MGCGSSAAAKEEKGTTQQQASKAMANGQQAADVEQTKAATTAIELHMWSGSPPSMATLMTAKALNVPINVHFVDFMKQEMKKPKFTALNFLQTVPVIEHQGFNLSESRAIMLYLVDTFAGGQHALYPKDLKKRTIINRMLFWDAATFYPPVIDYVYPVAFEKKDPDPVIRVRVERQLNTLERYLDQTFWCAGNEVSLADVSVYCGLLMLAEIMGWDFANKTPKVSNYMDKVHGLPYVKDVANTFIDLIANMKKGS